MDKFSKIKRVLIVILLFNWFVALSKILYGLITRCASMTADGAHSFADGASNIIGLVGIWAASKPKDESHPYGHKKFETFAALGIAAMLFMAAFNILEEAFARALHPVVPDVTVFSFIIMIFTMLVNIAVVKYERAKGIELSSDILLSDSLHTKSDIFASLAVIATLFSIKIGFSILDTVVASVIALLIIRSGIEILKAGSNVLCDRNVIEAGRIEDIVRQVPGVKSVHKIRTRGRCDDIHADLHVLVDPDTHVYDAHGLSHKITELLKRKISGVTDVSVHIEPSQSAEKG